MRFPKIITNPSFEDHRGSFCEMFRANEWAENAIWFVTDNQVVSKAMVFRGLHYQTDFPQGKLLTVPHGLIIDVSVDVRDWEEFGKTYYFVMSSARKQQLWIPPGFAHGYLSMVDDTVVHYKTTSYYQPDSEVVIWCKDPRVNLLLPDDIILSEKDRHGILLKDVPRIKV